MKAITQEFNYSVQAWKAGLMVSEKLTDTAPAACDQAENLLRVMPNIEVRIIPIPKPIEPVV